MRDNVQNSSFYIFFLKPRRIAGLRAVLIAMLIIWMLTCTTAEAATQHEEPTFRRTWWLSYTYGGIPVDNAQAESILREKNDPSINGYIDTYTLWKKALLWPKIIGAVSAIAGGLMWAIGNDRVSAAGMPLCIAGAGVFGISVCIEFFLVFTYQGKAVDRYNTLIRDSEAPKALLPDKEAVYRCSFRYNL